MYSIHIWSYTFQICDARLLKFSQYKNYFGNPDGVTQGGITASMAGGSLLGALFSTWAGDRFGRRDCLAIACVVFIVGSTLMSAVQNQAMLIVSRIINGFGVGILTSQGFVPPWTEKSSQS